MSQRNPNGREVALPASCFTALRRSLTEEAGSLTATHVLHAAGFQAGEALYETFSAGLNAPASSLSEGAFWESLSTFLLRRGWGSLAMEKIHPAIGLLKSRDWAEADPEAEESQPTCSFGAGFLSTLLTHVAGGPVAVLHVSCRSRGDEECGFAFGSESAIHLLYGRLLDGQGLEEALSGL